MELHLTVMMIVLDKLVAYLFEEGNRASVVVFNFGYDVVPAVHCEAEQLDCDHYLLGQSSASALWDCDHDVDFCLVWLYPLWEEQVDIPNHAVVLLQEYQKCVFADVLQPGPMVLNLLLQAQWLRPSQVQQLWVLAEPTVVLLDVVPPIGH